MFDRKHKESSEQQTNKQTKKQTVQKKQNRQDRHKITMLTSRVPLASGRESDLTSFRETRKEVKNFTANNCYIKT